MGNERTTEFGAFVNNPRIKPPQLFTGQKDFREKRAAYDPPPANALQDTGKPNPSVNVVPIDFNAGAVTDQEVKFEGSIVDFADSTNNSDVVIVKYDSKDAPGVRFRPGKSIDGIRFSRLFISWLQVVGSAGQLAIYKDYPEAKVTLT
jgi:hypothetical protein